MYPGVDPAKVEFFLEDGTNKLKYRPIAQAEPTEPTEAPAEETPEETPAEAPARDTAELAQLRQQLDNQNQLMQAILIAQAQGKPLAEVLGLQSPVAPEPDYSQLDLYDAPTLANFIKQAVQGAVNGALQPHQPALASARQQQEYNAVAAKHGSDPDFARKSALTTQLVQGNPNVSYEGTYALVSQIQASLGIPAVPPKAAAPVAPANQPKPATLTQEQADEKAAQAARLPQSTGVRGAGAPTPPEGIRKDFRKLAAWVAQQQALGNLP